MKDRIDGTFRDTGFAIDAVVRINHKHIAYIMKTITRAHINTSRRDAILAGFRYYKRHLVCLSFE